MLSAQEASFSDALVSPRIASSEISVGGENANVSGFNNQSIQYAFDALKQTGGTVILHPGDFKITAPIRM